MRHRPPSPRRVLWLLQCSTYTMTWPLPSSRQLLKDLSTATCSISNSIRFQLENLLHLLMVGGSPLCAINSDHVLLLHSSEEGVESCREICHLASDVSLTCKHSSCHTLPSTSTTFDSKFSNHGDASAAHKPTHIMTVRVAAFSPTKLHVAVRSSSIKGVLLVLRWPWYCSTSPESSVTRVDFSSSLFLTEFALWFTLADKK